MANNLATAIIGTGFMGPVHTEALRRLGVQVYGILGSSPEKSRRAAETLGLAKAYSDYNEVLSDEAIQVVHITTPNRFHFEQASQALQAGKHVLCEKPVVLNIKELKRLEKVATKTSSYFQEAFMIPHHPQWQWLQELEIGKIPSAHFIFSYPPPEK